MKKSVQYTGVCLALMTACFMFGACGDEPINVTMQQIYNANTTAALLQEYHKIGVVATDRNEVKTETYLDGAIYYEAVTSDGAIVRECYDKAGTVGYQKDADGIYYSLFVQADVLKAKPTQAYISQVFDNETLAVQEEILSATRKGDNIQVKTKLNESHSATVFALDGYAYQSGEYLETEYTLEKDTYHVLTAKRITKDADGATKLYETVEQKTRISPDGEIATLNARVQAVLSKTNLRQMKVSVDPNTINEELWGAYAVMGDRFKVDLGQNYPKLYTDADCTQEYEFADGDERRALIKLYTTKVFIPVEYDFTMQDIISANNDIKAWLQDCDSVTLDVHVVGERKTTFYFADNQFYRKQEDTQTTSVKEFAWLLDSGLRCENNDGVYRTGIEDTSSMSSWYNMLEISFQENEVIEYAEETGGKLKVTTKCVDKQDAVYVAEYVLSAQNYRMESNAVYLAHKDGTRSLIRTISIGVDEEIPAGAQALYARMEATENVRQVVIVVNPGTMNIEVYRLNVVQGDTFFMTGYTLYTDAECTQVFEDTAPYDTDCLLYAK